MAIKHTGVVIREEKAAKAPKVAKSEAVIGVLMLADEKTMEEGLMMSYIDSISSLKNAEELNQMAGFPEISDPMTYLGYEQRKLIANIFKHYGQAKVILNLVDTSKIRDEKTGRISFEQFEGLCQASIDKFKNPVAYIDKQLGARYKGEKPNILIAPNCDIKPVVEKLCEVGEELGAMVYSSAAFGADWEYSKQENSELKESGLRYMTDVLGDLKESIGLDADKGEGDYYQKLIDYSHEFKPNIRNLVLLGQSTLGKVAPYDHYTVKNRQYLAGYIAALRCKTDAEQGWEKVLSNVELDIYKPEISNTYLPALNLVQLDDGQARVDYMDMLNQAGIMSLTNIEDTWRMWGCRTTYRKDTDFIFENYTRIHYEIRKIISNSYLWALGKNIKGAGLPTDIVNHAKKILSGLLGDKIVGFDVWIEEKDNTTEDLVGGSFTIKFDFTAAPPLETLGITQIKTDDYIKNIQDSISFMYPQD